MRHFEFKPSVVFQWQQAEEEKETTQETRQESALLDCLKRISQRPLLGFLFLERTTASPLLRTSKSRESSPQDFPIAGHSCSSKQTSVSTVLISRSWKIIAWMNGLNFCVCKCCMCLQKVLNTPPQDCTQKMTSLMKNTSFAYKDSKKIKAMNFVPVLHFISITTEVDTIDTT